MAKVMQGGLTPHPPQPPPPPGGMAWHDRAVIVPAPADLQDLVRELHQSGTPWLPAGLASRLDWGAAIAQPCEVVSAAGLRGILEHSPGDFIVRVAAGTPLLELQQELAAHGQWLAVDVPPLTSAGRSIGGVPVPDPLRRGGSVGGLVARGLAGGYRQRYLGVRDQLIGIRILRADGIEARAGGKVVKNVAGYDLMRLFAGSWGSLGLITEVTLRTMPLPQHRVGLLLQGPAPALVEQAAGVLRSGLSPERLDLWSPALADAAGLGAEPTLLVALASVSAGSLREQLETIEGSPLRSQRCDAGELESLLAAAGPQVLLAEEEDPAAWLLRLGATPSRLAELLLHPALEGVAVDLAAGAGLGLAWAPAGVLAAERVLELRRLCRELGGHLAVLRQPQPPAGAPALPAWEDASSRALIEAVKAQFDPKLQLAPGRLPGVARPRCTTPGAGAAG